MAVHKKGCKNGKSFFVFFGRGQRHVGLAYGAKKIGRFFVCLVVVVVVVVIVDDLGFKYLTSWFFFLPH